MKTAMTIELPDHGGRIRSIELREPARLETSTRPPVTRRAYAAGHVVADPLRSSAGSGTHIDWDGTLQVRHRLWDLGLGIAESMDTAQRGMGLDAAQAMELATRTLQEAKVRGGQVVVGITTDGITSPDASLRQIEDAYLAQLDHVEAAGGSVVMMASRHLSRTGRGPEDYQQVYETVLKAASRPVILHWLGPMFDRTLAGYWGSTEVTAAAESVLAIIRANSERVAGIKLSLLDLDFEVGLRRNLPPGVRLFTGDDFNYSELIAGDDRGHSDALLGAFAAVPHFASAALKRLDQGDSHGFTDILDPTISLNRLIFEAPTQYYKVGVVWLSYLTGWQDHFRMIAGFETGRSLLHLADIFTLANTIGLFPDPEMAAARAHAYFRGVGA